MDTLQPPHSAPSSKPREAYIVNTTVQDEYLHRAIDTKEDMTVYLINGVRLVGKILRADTFSFVMTGVNRSNPNSEQLVYKNGTASVLKSSDNLKPQINTSR